MSSYNLRKATSRIQREDSITDLHIVTKWRLSKGLSPVTPGRPSVRAIENAVALSIKELDTTDLPKLVRGISFYEGCLKEIQSH